MASGYIYVLVNSSMPGLVKVGKTTREPAHRAAELSGVTGVATPFIVVFEQFFSDVDAAEVFIHTSLGRQGLRESENREFFRSQVNDVIKVVLQAPGLAEKHQDDLEHESEVSDGLLSEDDPLPDFQLEGWQPPKPWDDILEEADNYYYGTDDYIQDNVEALKLYKDAARLGSLVAYEKIGSIYEDGLGVRQDLNKALEYWKEGANRGNYYCYAAMSSLFFGNSQLENFYKAFKQFLKRRNASHVSEIEDFRNKHIYHIYGYLKYCVTCSLEVRYVDDLMSFREELRRFIKDSIVTRQNDTSLVIDWASDADTVIFKWVQDNLFSDELAPAEPIKLGQPPLRASDANENIRLSSSRRSSIFSKLFGRS